MTETVETCWEIECPFSGETFRYDTQGEATRAAISRNKADDRHPAFRLYKVYGADRCFKGILSREFGRDFDVRSCWANA